MYGYIRTREISIEEEEAGFVLIIENDGDRLTVNIQDVAEQLYDQARARIGPWLRERDEARGAFRCNPDESGGVLDAWREAYPISDPKHPDYHSVHADIWDAREGK